MEHTQNHGILLQCWCSSSNEVSWVGPCRANYCPSLGNFVLKIHLYPQREVPGKSHIQEKPIDRKKPSFLRLGVKEYFCLVFAETLSATAESKQRMPKCQLSLRDKPRTSHLWHIFFAELFTQQAVPGKPMTSKSKIIVPKLGFIFDAHLAYLVLGSTSVQRYDKIASTNIYRPVTPTLWKHYV